MIQPHPVRLLTLAIREPLPGKVLHRMIPETSPEEAAKRYRAIALTTLRQLRGLKETSIRLEIQPHDADEAIRFWLLPLLADRWLADGNTYKSDGWEIDFGTNHHGAPIQARGEILCPFLGTRWFHAALAGIGTSVGSVLGPGESGGTYLECRIDDGLPIRRLPKLPIIETAADWQAALDSPIGPALARSMDEQR